MKTSNYLKVSLGFLITLIVIIAIAEALAKKKLKTCESRQSFRCPRFTCPMADGTPGKPGQCGHRPYICSDSDNTCNDKICIGYCSKKEENKCFA